MRTEYYKTMEFKFSLPRKAAEKLRRLVKENKEFSELVSQIDRALSPVYCYTMPCVGCGKECKYGSATKITNEEAKKRWAENCLCQSCVDSEDFK